MNERYVGGSGGSGGRRIARALAALDEVLPAGLARLLHAMRLAKHSKALDNASQMKQRARDKHIWIFENLLSFEQLLLSSKQLFVLSASDKVYGGKSSEHSQESADEPSWPAKRTSADSPALRQCEELQRAPAHTRSHCTQRSTVLVRDHQRRKRKARLVDQRLFKAHVSWRFRIGMQQVLLVVAAQNEMRTYISSNQICVHLANNLRASKILQLRIAQEISTVCTVVSV